MKKQLSLILIVIAISSVIFLVTLLTKPTTGKSKPEVKPQLVEVVAAFPTKDKILITVYGTVQANRELTMKAEVSGRVIYKSEHLVKGGRAKKEEVVLKLDPRDYLNLIQQENASLERAKFELKQERGRQFVAKREWEQLKSSIAKTELSEELALRKPHLKEKEAALKAAESRLQKAKLDLQRTILKSPMNAIVVDETVELGDYVTPQTEIAKLVSTDAFRVQVSIPVDKLRWIRSDQNSLVKVIHDLGGGKTIVRNGKILRLLGDLDPSGRMARLLILVEDPLGLEETTSHPLPLLIGTYVRVEIEGPEIASVYVLPREALREENKIWIKTVEGRLEIREVDVVQRHPDTVTIRNGIKKGEEIVISHLPLALPGMELSTP